MSWPSSAAGMAQDAPVGAPDDELVRLGDAVDASVVGVAEATGVRALAEGGGGEAGEVVAGARAHPAASTAKPTSNELKIWIQRPGTSQG